MPSGEQKHTVERYALSADGTQLEISIFVEDPEYIVLTDQSMGEDVTRAPLAILLLLLASGCLTRPVREDVFKEDAIEVFLRSEKRWSQTLEKQYEHPVTIASVRMAHTHWASSGWLLTLPNR